MDCIKNTLKKGDALGYQEIERLQVGGSKQQKSSVGGLFTICLLFVYFGLIVYKGTQLFQYDGTYEYKGSLNDDEEIFINSSKWKFAFNFRDNAQSIDFDPSKIDAYISHNLYEFNLFGWTNKTTRYDLRKCTYQDFNSTEDERNIWNFYADILKLHPYCIDDPNNSLSLIGSIKSAFDSNPFSNLNIKVDRCQNQSIKAGNVQCSTKEEIDSWLEGKTIDMLIVKQRLVLQPPYDISLNQELRSIRSVPLSKDTRSTGNYVLKKLMVEDPTTFLGQFTQQPEVTDYVGIEEDTFVTLSTKNLNYSESIYEPLENSLAEFKFMQNQYTTKTILKQTFRITDLLAYIGGTMTSMLLVFSFMTVRYQRFNSDLKMSESFDVNITPSFPDDKGDLTTKKLTPKISAKQQRQIGFWEKIRIYLGFFSPLKYVFCCLRARGAQIKKKVKNIEHIQQILKDKFDVRTMIIDIATLIYNQRNILQELKMSPPQVNFMKEWLSKPGEGNEEENSRNQLLAETSKIQQQEQKTIELLNLDR